MRDGKNHVTTVMVPSIEYVYLRYKGGAGISKVVRPLQIKITRACARGGKGDGGGGCSHSKCVGSDAVRLGRARLLICRQKSGNDYKKHVQCTHG